MKLFMKGRKNHFYKWLSKCLRVFWFKSSADTIIIHLVICKRMWWNKALVISYQAYMSKFFDVFKKFALSFNLSKITLTLLSSTYYFKQPLTQNEIWLWKDFKTKRFAKAFSRTTSDVGLNHNHWFSWFSCIVQITRLSNKLVKLVQLINSTYT